MDLDKPLANPVCVFAFDGRQRLIEHGNCTLPFLGINQFVGHGDERCGFGFVAVLELTRLERAANDGHGAGRAAGTRFECGVLTPEHTGIVRERVVGWQQIEAELHHRLAPLRNCWHRPAPLPSR